MPKARTPELTGGGPVEKQIEAWRQAFDGEVIDAYDQCAEELAQLEWKARLARRELELLAPYYWDARNMPSGIDWTTESAQNDFKRLFPRIIGRHQALAEDWDKTGLTVDDLLGGAKDAKDGA